MFYNNIIYLIDIQNENKFILLNLTYEEYQYLLNEKIIIEKNIIFKNNFLFNDNFFDSNLGIRKKGYFLKHIDY